VPFFLWLAATIFTARWLAIVNFFLKRWCVVALILQYLILARLEVSPTEKLPRSG